MKAEKKDQDFIDRMFDALDIDSRGYIRKDDLINALKVRGILDDDARIKDAIKYLNKNYKKNDDISLASFRKIVGPNVTLIEKALTGSLIIPDFKNFCSFITNIFNRTIQNRGGKVSDYIPELENIDHENYAVSICTVDGQRYNIGKYNVPFISRSTCKPINYCLALEELGEEEVHKHIGRAPKEKGFNDIMLNQDGLPHNPLNNSGAIMCTSLIKSEIDMESRFSYILKKWKSMSGEIEAGFNKKAFLSEQRVADKDFALAYFMQQNKLFPKGSDLKEYIDLLFKCLAIETTTEAQSVVAATLANAGVCPTNGEKVLSPETAKNCLSLMYSCGMGDYSSEFAFSIGLPAKSGVSGSIMLVVPFGSS